MEKSTFFEIYQELRTWGQSKETALKILAKLEGCKNGQVAGWVLATSSGASHKLIWLASPLQEKIMRAQSLNHVRFFAAPWTVALQAPLAMGFSKQEH